jgi:hypothetical protein
VDGLLILRTVDGLLILRTVNRPISAARKTPIAVKTTQPRPSPSRTTALAAVTVMTLVRPLIRRRWERWRR